MAHVKWKAFLQQMEQKLTNHKKTEKNNPFFQYARITSIFSQMFIIMALFTFGGFWLDKYLQNTHKILTIVFSLIGFLLALYITIREITKIKKNDSKNL